MTFSRLFSKSWNQYWNNFKPIFYASLILYGLPLLLVSLIGLFAIYSSGYYSNLSDTLSSTYSSFMSGNYSAYTSQASANNLSILNQKFFGTFILLVPLGIISSLISLIFYFGLIASSMKKEKFSLINIFRNGTKNYWRFLGFSIVYSIFLFLLFLLLIIPGIIFAIYWIFAIFIFFERNSRIRDSLSRSFKIVRGKWWKTLSYVVLLILIMLGILIIVNIPAGIINFASFFGMLFTGRFSFWLLLLNLLFSWITKVISFAITVPLIILFLKNYYLSLKK